MTLEEAEAKLNAHLAERPLIYAVILPRKCRTKRKFRYYTQPRRKAVKAMQNRITRTY